MNARGSAAIVFGGASGLGEAVARRLTQEGANVVIADLAATEAAGLAEELGGRSTFADVADSASVEAAVKVAAGLAGGLRICVNCAGIGPPARLVGRDGPTPLDRFARVIEVNLVGTINVMRLAAPAMFTAEPDEHGERGVFVNTASVAAFEGEVGQVAYSAAKSGVAALTLPAAREFASRGVRVVAVAPGLFDTPMLAPMGEPVRDALAGSTPFPSRLGDPAEYADLVRHIVGNRMLNGEVVRLDGAFRVAPR